MNHLPLVDQSLIFCLVLSITIVIVVIMTVTMIIRVVVIVMAVTLMVILSWHTVWGNVTSHHALEWHIHPPVSYTHLDVYKRQDQ